MSNHADVDALRFRLARRLAPAARHDALGRLHPIALLADVLERQLAVPAPDLDALRRNAGLLHAQLKKELPAFTKMGSFFFADKDAVVALGPGVGECVALLAADLGLRGQRIDNRVGNEQVQVSRVPLGVALAASLFAAADAADTACDFSLRAAVCANDVVLSIDRKVREHAVPPQAQLADRFSWPDVAALALAEGVALSRSENTVELRFHPQRG